MSHSFRASRLIAYAILWSSQKVLLHIDLGDRESYEAPLHALAKSYVLEQGITRLWSTRSAPPRSPPNVLWWHLGVVSFPPPQLNRLDGVLAGRVGHQGDDFLLEQHPLGLVYRYILGS